MKREVAATLAELERKLRELELELAQVSRGELDEGASVERPPDPEIGGAGEPLTVSRPTPASQVRLIDETEQLEANPVQEAPPSSGQRDGQSIDLLELVRFREHLERTLSELVEEYGKILSLRAPEEPPRAHFGEH